MTLGTNTNSDTAMFRSVIDGLCDLDVDVLLTIGHGRDPAAIGPLSANAHVENYVPQSVLLPHCPAVICHGGAGTTLNSLTLGLASADPAPGADQYLIGDLVVASGAGLVLSPADVSPSTVRAGVITLLGSDEPWPSGERAPSASRDRGYARPRGRGAAHRERVARRHAPQKQRPITRRGRSLGVCQ
jgi:UDP:flavonoid glycosyltransferase YjiC (YdhE family)